MQAIARELAFELAVKKCGVPVVVGPERATANTTLERIVVAPAPDTFGPARSQHENPKQRMTRQVGGTITIFAQSTAPGATPEEHDDRCDLILDQVLVAMAIVASKRNVKWSPKSGGDQPDADLGKSEIEHGSKYVLNFTIDRGVYDRTFQGAAAPETTIGGAGGVVINRTTKVFSQGHGPNADEPGEGETSCGEGA